MHIRNPAKSKQAGIDCSCIAIAIDYGYDSSPSSLIVILKSLNDSSISSLGSTLNLLSVHWKASLNHHRLCLNLVLEILLAFLLAGSHPFWDAYYNLVQESLCLVIPL